ncbi:hypothetical protein IWW34DRAFT_364818 [Fusarium oxysporum f. sp. albedinis]|nr:hypothetical protein IWW34DRAFT_364818 [Fusarium oxysporum f. sp. albedinis]
MYRHSDHMNPRNEHTEDKTRQDKTNDSICATEFITVSPDKFAVSLNRKALLECPYSIEFIKIFKPITRYQFNPQILFAYLFFVLSHLFLLNIIIITNNNLPTNCRHLLPHKRLVTQCDTPFPHLQIISSLQRDTDGNRIRMHTNGLRNPHSSHVSHVQDWVLLFARR